MATVGYSYHAGPDFTSLVQTNSPVADFIVVLPSFSTRDPGVTTRNAILSQVITSTPGRHSSGIFEPQQPTFFQIFFFNYIASIFYNDVRFVTGQNDNNFWSNYAVALQCQSMYQNTREVRDRLNIDQINSDMNSYNNDIQSRAWKLYVYVLRNQWFKTQFNAITNKNQAKTDYINYLKSPTFIQSRKELANKGHWNGNYYGSPEWELFHHWMKLYSLGATESEISTLSTTLNNLGLPNVPKVTGNAWKSYYLFFKDNSLTISNKDIDNICMNSQLKGKYIPNMGMYPTYFAEESSYEFIANGQPGKKYRKPPKSSSCFVKGTMVLMADGSLKPIQSVVAGDKITTTSGPWPVLAVASPPRRGRTLYSLNSATDIQFTATHPFIAATPGRFEKYTCIDPETLKELVPLTMDAGISKLTVGSYVTGWSSSQTSYGVPVSAINQHLPVLPDEVVYDVIVAPDQTTFNVPSYIVSSGDGSVQFVVASEIPPLSYLPHATISAIKILSNALPDLVQNLQNVSANLLENHMEILLDGITGNLIHHADNIRDNPGIVATNTDSISEQILDNLFGGSNMYQTLGGEIYDRVFGSLVEEIFAISEINPDVHDLADPDTPIMDLAVSLLHFDAGLIPDVIAENLDYIVIKFIVDGVELDSAVVYSTQARYQTKFVKRFYKTVYFPGYEAQNSDTKIFNLDFDFHLNNNVTLYARQFVPNLDEHSARFATPIVLEQLGEVKQESGRLGLLLRNIPHGIISDQEQNTMAMSASTPLDEDLIGSIGDAISGLSGFSQTLFALEGY